MTHTDTGTYGAKRQTWFGSGVRAIFRRVRKRLPDANDDDLVEAMVAAVRKDDDAIRQLLAYWIPRNRLSLEPPEPVSPQRRAAAKRRREKLDAQMRQRIERISLMSTMIVVGKTEKPRGECTREEIAANSKFDAAIAAGMKTGQRVREAYTEAQLWKLRP